MTDEREAAEMHPAYLWDCPGCDAENVVRVPVRELSGEEVRELLVENGEIEDWQETPDDVAGGTEVMGVPEAVRCHRCGETFDAMVPLFGNGGHP